MENAKEEGRKSEPGEISAKERGGRWSERERTTLKKEKSNGETALGAGALLDANTGVQRGGSDVDLRGFSGAKRLKSGGIKGSRGVNGAETGI